MDWTAIFGRVSLACIAIVVGEGLVGNEGFGTVLWVGVFDRTWIFGCNVYTLAVLASFPISPGFALSC